MEEIEIGRWNVGDNCRPAKKYHTKPKQAGGIDKVLEERQKTHGEFSSHARYTQQIKEVFRSSPDWGRLNDHQKEAMDMFAHKQGRILNGNPNVKDHWTDIAGYATLVERTLK